MALKILIHLYICLRLYCGKSHCLVYIHNSLVGVQWLTLLSDYSIVYYIVPPPPQIAPALSLLHQHLSLMLPLCGEVLSRAYTVILDCDGKDNLLALVRGRPV